MELEYLLTHRGKRGQSFEYELIYDGDGGNASHLAGLIDTNTIKSSRGDDAHFAGATRPESGPISASTRGEQDRAQADEQRLSEQIEEAVDEAHFYPNKNESLVVTYPREWA